MAEQEEKQNSEQDLSEGKLIDQEPLDQVEDPPVRLAGYNQIPDFGDDNEGTLKEENQQTSNK
jgi:hypothetical protein